MISFIFKILIFLAVSALSVPAGITVGVFLFWRYLPEGSVFGDRK